MKSGIVGVKSHDLITHQDDRGELTELFREEWLPSHRPIQWNCVRSGPNVLRGVHCHVKHHDYLGVTAGELILGLIDLRAASPTFRNSELHRIRACQGLIVVPPGVGHGFYFEIPSQMVYGVSAYWDVDDELGCRWNDPGLQIGWPCSDPKISKRDAEAGSLSALIDDVTRGIAPTDIAREHL